MTKPDHGSLPCRGLILTWLLCGVPYSASTRSAARFNSISWRMRRCRTLILEQKTISVQINPWDCIFWRDVTAVCVCSSWKLGPFKSHYLPPIWQTEPFAVSQTWYQHHHAWDVSAPCSSSSGALRSPEPALGSRKWKNSLTYPSEIGTVPFSISVDILWHRHIKTDSSPRPFLFAK